MGRIAKLLSFVRTSRNDAKVSDVKVNLGGGENITVEHFASPGDDSFPLDTDYLYVGDIKKTGGEAAVGYIDPVNNPKALEGDKRIYGRDSATGLVIVEIWLKNDGTALISNDNGSVTLNPDGSIKGLNGSGSFELQAAGNFVVNGVTIDSSGNITTPASIVTPSIVVNGKEQKDHIHGAGTLIDSVAGPVTGVTGVTP